MSDLSNYATKADWKNATGVDISKFAEKIDLASLKSNLDKLDIARWKTPPSNSGNLKNKIAKLDADKLGPVPVEVSKLRDVVKNDVVIRDAYNTEIKNIENKKSDITKLATNDSLNAKINEVKCKIRCYIK